MSSHDSLGGETSPDFVRMTRVRDAADDLLAALKGLTGLAVLRGGHLHEYRAAVEAAEAAIARAEGRS